ncbi:hypothetical protein SCHPADRAFT_900335 [Schizopora paradoxa]|uniref:Uncharacterized protein n=1 Tax=Schizopora paradoxa TaxID=27342 RepID=A0A0H2S098_9AGAM|nr:hypothetical protein SCHPADRAFT_900335 [Schizopora paradoxa]
MADETQGAADLSAAADEHARILQTISEYDSAPAELRDTDNLYKSLDRDIKAREVRLKQLVKNRMAEHKDVDNLQRSKTKRLFVYIKHGGKEGLSKRMEKEEREYIEAAQAEFNETIAIKELKEAAENAKTKKEGLERKVEERKRLLSQLDSLYSAAFNGPTPDFPEEDAAETELREAEDHYERQQSILNQRQQVTDIMQKALQTTRQMENSLQNASRNGTLDTFGIGGIWAELAERDHLMRAQGLASHVDMLIRQVQSMTPEVNGLRMPKIVSPEWLNVVFDNLYTDILFQRKITESLNSVLEFKQDLVLYCRRFDSSVEELKNDVQDAANFLRSKRRGLIAVRREILTRVAEDHVDAPPTYRADAPSGSLDISSRLADVSIAMPRGPGESAREPPPPAYGIPSAPRDGLRYAPPPGPPPGRERSQSRQRSELPPASPTMPTMPTAGGMETIYSPPRGPPPVQESRPGPAFNRTLSASSSGRSRSLSPHPRSPSGSARASPSSSPHAWNKPLPASPIMNPQASSLFDGGSPSFQASGLRSRSPSPFPASPRSPSSPGTSQFPPHDVTPSMQFPEPNFTLHSHDASFQPQTQGPNLGSPWRMQVLDANGDDLPNHSDAEHELLPAPQMPTANPFLDPISAAATPAVDENAREASAAPGTLVSGAEQARSPTEASAGLQGQEEFVNTRSRPLASKNPFRQSMSS